MRRLLTAVLVCCLLGVAGVAGAPPAVATTFTVTDGGDSGPGTFVAAMDAATADTTGPHIIEFTPGLVVEKDTTEAYYFGTQPLTINGNGSTITGLGNSVRLITLVTAADVVINDLTLTDTAVSSGGALFSNGDGNVTINDSIVTDHEGNSGAGAIRGAKAASSLTITHSIVGSNSSTIGAGGAINQTGPLVIEDSYFHDNHAPASVGGAIAALDDVTVRRSFFSGNTADTVGGIYSQTGGMTTVVSNSTFIDNHTTGTFIGGAALSASNLQIDQSTFAGNDGTATGVGQVAFISSDGHSITRTVLLEPGADDKNCVGNLLRTTGYTYSTDNTCTGIGGVATGDVESGADPQLGQLRNNGGQTPSRFPLSGSPLIDAVPNADCTQVDDQRVVARPFPAAGACDIGAVEAVFPAHIFTDVTPFYEATVRWITSAVNTPNILDGYDNGTFRHTLNITRGQAARLYYRAAGEPDVDGLDPHGFTDVTEFFEDSVRWAKSEGIFNGYVVDNTFRQKNPITRGDSIRSLYGFAGSPDVSGEDPHGFGDVSVFYEDAVKWAKAFGLVNGYAVDNTFRQKNNITRGDASRTAYNLAQTKPAWFDTMVAPNNMLFKNNLIM